MKRRLILMLVFLLSISLLAAACGGNNNSGNTGNSGASGTEGNSSGQAEAKDDTPKKHAIIFKNAGNPYGEKMIEGFREAMAELGHEVIAKAPDQPTAEAQIQIIEELIAQMDAAGVTHAVISAMSLLADPNTYTLEALAAHPDRLRATLDLDGRVPRAELERS